MKDTRWYMRRLQRYFDMHYGEYGDTAGYLVNPAPNQWKFCIDEIDAMVTLTCEENGVVTEKRVPIPKRFKVN